MVFFSERYAIFVVVIIIKKTFEKRVIRVEKRVIRG